MSTLTTDVRTPAPTRTADRRTTAPTRTADQRTRALARTANQRTRALAPASDQGTPAPARTTALRAADGVIAGYIRSLAHANARPTGPRAAKQALGRLAAHAYECGAGRGSGLATRRRPALRRMPAAA